MSSLLPNAWRAKKVLVLPDYCIDLALDVMYEAIKKDGVWVLK